VGSKSFFQSVFAFSKAVLLLVGSHVVVFDQQGQMRLYPDPPRGLRKSRIDFWHGRTIELRVGRCLKLCHEIGEAANFHIIFEHSYYGHVNHLQLQTDRLRLYLPIRRDMCHFSRAAAAGKPEHNGASNRLAEPACCLPRAAPRRQCDESRA